MPKYRRFENAIIDQDGAVLYEEIDEFLTDDQAEKLVGLLNSGFDDLSWEDLESLVLDIDPLDL